jgi:FlaA1/EpsC-like NDP-sugar epimerase
MKIAIARRRRVLLLLLQLVLAAASNLAAFLIRFDGALPPVHVQPFLLALPVLLVLRLSAFQLFGLHQGLWRYAGVWDLQRIVAAVTLSTAAFALVVNGLVDVGPYPRSIHVIDTLLLTSLLGGFRLLRRAYRQFDRFQKDKRVLIFGAGDAGEMLVRDMKNNRLYNSEPIGFIDDDRGKLGRTIHGVRVLGTRADLPRILAEEQPHEVIVATPTASPAQVRAIVRALEPFKIPIKTLPNLRDVLQGRVSVEHIRRMKLEDLMARQPVDLSPEPVERLVQGRRVLVTGAGGSIGSELARQLAGFGPAALVLLDRYENALFELVHDLAHRDLAHIPIIADVTDSARVDRVFATFLPDVVFHAAAHKHVPLMEANPAEAVKNNVTGTRVLGEAAVRHGVREFVLISTDKAVNPSSVMGATKRVAELITRGLAAHSGTRFVAVRFGNVLGSNGSVVQIFQQQIARGGPVTVTHPDMRRYFMLIPEAVSLVLHAAARRGDGTICVLDMGEQVNLLDFARNVIRLAGYVPEDEISITFIGPRPGEKLSEELWEEGETVESSGVNSFYVLRHKPVRPDWRALVTDLEAAAAAEEEERVISLLGELVPTFVPAAHAAGSQPAAAR